MIDRGLFALKIHELGVIFGKTLSPDALKLYHRVLSDSIETDEDFILTCDRLSKKHLCEYGIGFPLPAHFLKHKPYRGLYTDEEILLMRKNGGILPKKEEVRDEG